MKRISKSKKNKTFQHQMPKRNFIQQQDQISKSDEIFNSLEEKLTKELIDRGLIKSFHEINEMDRIIINEENFSYIMEDDSTLNTELRKYIPFITNGVMMFDTKQETMYYHFTVSEIGIEEGYIKLNVDIYSFYNDLFSKVIYLECILNENKDGKVVCTFTKGKHDFHYYHELINDKNDDNFKLTNLEEFVFKNKYADFLLYLNSKHSNEYNLRPDLIHPFSICMVYLNNCIEKQCLNNKNNSRHESTNHDHVVKLAESKNNTVKDRTIIINGIKIQKGKNSQIKTRQGNVIINRHTQVWSVAGHIRHYKDGRTVYINSYKKGPGRYKEDHTRKIYKLKTE